MIYPPISQLRAFVAIAEHRSFRGAANLLNLSQPALSGQIRELEQTVRISLFHRTTRSVQLTADGEKFLIRVRRALDELDPACMK
jgi:DNA-binding transcriptional LysR family regulator